MDLQVRLAELSVTGSLRSTKKLAQHRGPAHKMTLLPDSPYIVLSAGEDGQVLSWHWSWSITCFPAGFVHWYQRAQTWQDIAFTEWKRQKGMHCNGQVIVRFNPIFQVPIYSIHSSPTNSHLFCTSGRSNVGPFDWHLKLFCFQGSVYQGLWSKISWAWGQGRRPGSSQSDDMNIIIFWLFFVPGLQALSHRSEGQWLFQSLHYLRSVQRGRPGGCNKALSFFQKRTFFI